MAVRNKVLLLLVLIVACAFLASIIRTSYRRHMATKYNGDGECTYLNRVGLLGSDGYKITLESFPLNEEYKATYHLKSIPLNHQVYDVALEIPDAEYGYKGLNSSFLTMHLSDNTGQVYFDVSTYVGNYTHAYPPFHIYFYDPNSNPVFSTVDIKGNREYSLHVHYIPHGIDDDVACEGNFFLKTGGFK